jgi:uncharacterized protein
MQSVLTRTSVRCASNYAAAASAANPHVYMALFYEYDAKDAEEMVQKRAPFRAAHLEHAKKSKLLALGGAFTDSPIGAMLLFRTEDKTAVEAFAKADPYVKGKFVKSYSVRPWTVVADSLSGGELR